MAIWTVYASLSATPPTPLIPLPFTSDRRGTHGFILTILLYKTVIFFKTNQIWIEVIKILPVL
jgi:hypothetical protein